MAISDTQKVDLLFKKIGFGLTKTDVSGNKSPSNESIASEVPTYAQNIWAEAGSIPGTPPGTTTTPVQVYSVSAGASQLNLTQDGTADPLRTFLTNLADWIPFSFGSLYAVKVYIGDPGAAGTQIFPDGSGNSDEFYFDYQAGVLNFIGDNIPAGVAAGNIYVEGYRYNGAKGLESAGISTLNFADITARNSSSTAEAGDIAIVADDGDGEYAIYIANASGPTSDWTLVSSKDSADSSEASTHRVTVEFNTINGQTLIANPSQGKRITNMMIEIDTAFDGGGADLTVGTIAIPNDFMTSDEIDLTAVGESFVGFTNYVFPDALDADNDIVFNFTQGTSPTVGSATITVTVA